MKTQREECNRTRYCHFHCDYSHDTEECHDLKNQIKDLIRRGHLDRYIRKLCEPSPHPKGPIEKQIDIIIGSPTSGGDTSSARKAYARATATVVALAQTMVALAHGRVLPLLVVGHPCKRYSSWQAPPRLLVTTLLVGDRPCGRPRPYAVAPIGGSPGPGDCPLWPGCERSPLLAVLVACGCPCRGPSHSWMWVAALVGDLS
ncbi:hypothetical protein B296_00013037 [Ensete ventricosum]|uniref:Reverse transcriptase domain-containing protein n=1 Tax=Ensete ventricosum TaxID=4639 RepID=A0A427ABG5_ENSVE|nr:hypothetical protein B296_00013037 [Ensete ventricosum]